MSKVPVGAGMIIEKKIDQSMKLFNCFQYGISIDWRTSHTQSSQQKRYIPQVAQVQAVCDII